MLRPSCVGATASCRQMLEWNRQLYVAVQPYVAPAVYVNYLDRDLCNSTLGTWSTVREQNEAVLF